MSKIVARFVVEPDGTERCAGAEFSRRCPAVIYQGRLNGFVTRVEREGKGDHLTLIRQDGIELIVMPGRGVVGRLGYSGQSDSFVLWDYRTNESIFADSREDIIGEAGLHWLT